MASTLMHLFVGYSLAGGPLRERIDSPAQYYLGCIAPDSVNVNGFAPKKIRWAAHLRDRDLSRWEQNAAGFYRAHTGREDESLLLGYVVHLLADLLWDRHFHEDVWTRAAQLHPQDGEPGWEECFRYDFSQLDASWWTGAARPALQSARAAAIGSVDAGLMEAYRTQTLEEYPATLPREHPTVITAAMMDRFSGYTAESLLRFLPD